jgi:hypothetical protein
MQNPFNKVPKDVIRKILLSSDINTISRYCQTDTRSRDICSTTYFWYQLILRDFSKEVDFYFYLFASYDNYESFILDVPYYNKSDNLDAYKDIYRYLYRPFIIVDTQSRPIRGNGILNLTLKIEFPNLSTLYQLLSEDKLDKIIRQYISDKTGNMLMEYTIAMTKTVQFTIIIISINENGAICRSKDKMNQFIVRF